MHSISRKLVALVIFLSPVCTHATAVLQVNQAGVLTGATGVLVDGAAFDVNFVDGNCIGLFNGCDGPDDFIFNTIDSVTLAAQALLDQVLVGQYDTTPSQVNGCTSTAYHCTVLTPWTVSPVYSLYARTAAVFNYSDQQWSSDAINPTNDIFNYYSTDRFSSTYTYAVWSAAAASVAVPEPSHIALWLLGLAAMRFPRRVRCRMTAAE